MRDYKKFCRPNTITNPKYGDKIITLNCGKKVYVDAQEFERVKKYYKNVSTYVYKDKAAALVGDIVVEGNKIVSREEFNQQDKKAIGILFLNSTNAPDGKARMVSLDYMDYNDPVNGNSGSGVSMMWGADGSIGDLQYFNQVPCMSTAEDQILTEEVQRVVSYSYIPTDYFTGIDSAVPGYKYYTNVQNGLYSPPIFLNNGNINPQAVMQSGVVPGTSTQFTIKNALVDFNGKDNTLKILNNCTVSVPINSVDPGNYPAAQVCSLYKDGSWHLPAGGELACLVSNFKNIDTTRMQLGYSSYNYSDYYYWSSTLHSPASARSVLGSSGGCYGRSRSTTYASSRVLAVSAF